MAAAPPVDIVLDLPRDCIAATIARRRLVQDLTERLKPQQFIDLKMVVSELVTNAVIHGRGAIRLEIHVTDDDVKGEVIDDGTGFEPDVRDVGVDELDGRGLLFVQRLTSRWGVREAPTRVWFEMLARR